MPSLESVAADLRYAFRTLRHSLGFTLVVLVTLALGIGANTAIFSVLRGVLFKPLPHRDGDRLVYLRHTMDGPGRASITFSVPEVRDLRTGVRALAGIAEYSDWSMTLQSGDRAVRMPVGLVTGNYFEVMGLSPIAGRVTDRGDDGPGVPAVMVLTHEGWMKRFGGDPEIVGKQVILDKKPVTVIGILQPAPFFPTPVDGILNMVASEHHLSALMVEGRTHRMTEVVARLAPGATLEQARTEVAAVYARMQTDHPEAYEPAAHPRVAVMPFKEVLGERARLTLWLLMGAAAFVLIISAANVVNLTLMRGVRREPELVVRAALGAGVARLRRLLLVENLVLSITGAAAGLVVAILGVGLLTSLAARYSPRASEIRLDSAVLGFALAVAVLLALLLSFAASLPKEGALASSISIGIGHSMTGSLKKQRVQRALVVVQVAVSVMLLAGAGLLTRTVIRLSEVKTGLGSEELLTMYVTLLTSDEARNPATDAAGKQRYEQMRRELAALPGVIAAGVGSTPLRSSNVQFEVKAEGRPSAAGQAVPVAELRTADPDYFHAAGIPLLSGRPFSTTDGPGSGKVAIINQTLADLLFPNEDPVGKRVAWSGDVLRFTRAVTGDWRTVVGVVGRTQDGGLDAEPRPVMFMPFAQFPAFGGALVIRTEANAAALIETASRTVRGIAPAALIENVMTIAQYKDQSVAPRRLNAGLLAAFGALAVIMAAVGIAGVLAFSVSTRTFEIGIRMSLGADSGRVQRMILREGGVLLAIGLCLGVACAYAAAGLIRGLLFGVAPDDPPTFAGVALLMAAIGILACWVPALRAARVDPAIAMRA